MATRTVPVCLNRRWKPGETSVGKAQQIAIFAYEIADIVPARGRKLGLIPSQI